MSEDLALTALSEYLDACEAGIASAKAMIKKEKVTPLENPDFNKLTWQTVEGTKGPYEQTTREANKSNTLFEALSSKLKEKGGFWQEPPYKYWLHQNDPDIIDRRKA